MTTRKSVVYRAWSKLAYYLLTFVFCGCCPGKRLTKPHASAALVSLAWQFYTNPMALKIYCLIFLISISLDIAVSRWEAAVVSGTVGFGEGHLHPKRSLWDHWEVSTCLLFSPCVISNLTIFLKLCFFSLQHTHYLYVLLFLCRYLQRFDSELEQIELMNGIKGRQGRLHVAREAVIKQTIEREREQYEGAGFGTSLTQTGWQKCSVHEPCQWWKKHCFVLDRDPRYHQWKASESIQVSVTTQSSLWWRCDFSYGGDYL